MTDEEIKARMQQVVSSNEQIQKQLIDKMLAAVAVEDLVIAAAVNGGSLTYKANSAFNQELTIVFRIREIAAAPSPSEQSAKQ